MVRELYVRVAATVQVFVVCLVLAGALKGQTAEISGFVRDPSGLAVPDAHVTLKNPLTGITRNVRSNAQGAYGVSALTPGSWDTTVSAAGFQTIHQNDVAVEVDQRARLDFALTVSGAHESVVVQGPAPLLNVVDASVSTVVSNEFVENMPLNGRSFSSLIGLTPGVVLAPANTYQQGQFSVNGQRPDANYFMVDGVSANLGSAGNGALLRQGGAGQLPAYSAFGGSSNLVSLDALLEFRVQTSSFAPEYGRTPGAQVSVVTKSGTNSFHGDAFEYFRNDKLDANDWFGNAKGIPRPELRQNDFGGVLGGPIQKDRLFFFVSWEAVRVRQPHVVETYVPSIASREDAVTTVQPLLDAFPLPNGPDLGNGTAAFSAGYSDPSSLSAYSGRVDYALSPSVTLFGRYSDASSGVGQRGNGVSQGAYSAVTDIKYRTQSVTLGSFESITARVANEVRFNYSRSRAHTFTTLDNFGRAVPFSVPAHSSLQFLADFTPYGLNYDIGEGGDNLTQQINITENLSLVTSAHNLKFGLDYRRLHAESALVPYQVQYGFLSLSNALHNSLPVAFVVSRTSGTQLVFPNWSLFAQDTWTASPRLTLTWGVRWDYDAPPSSPNGTLPFTVTGVNNVATMTLAPQGTPLWRAQKDDFAPRVALAWNPSGTIVLRVGAGLFYDLGYASVANGMGAFPYVQTKTVTDASFPLSADDAAPAPFTAAPPVQYLSVVNPDHVLPRTWEWNAAVEKTFGASDVLTITYVGALGRRLMRLDAHWAPNPAFTGEFDLMSNGALSSYQALEPQFRHRWSHGLQALLSYAWGHAIDDVSTDSYYVHAPARAQSSERGSSDSDVRQTFSGAISYEISARARGAWKPLLRNWSIDSIVYARTAPPVNVVTGLDPFGTRVLSGAASAQRPNLVPGAPLWISDPNVAGGKRINPGAFSVPAGPVQGDLGRNTLRGFGTTQVDIGLRRQFRLGEGVSFQVRSDFFNVFNHPNFGPPISYMSSPLFGQATQMLGNSLGDAQNGGVNPLYQIGGARSIQLALKLLF